MLSVQVSLSGRDSDLIARQVVAGVFQRLHRTVGRALHSEAKTIRAEVQSHVASHMKVVKKSFLKGFRAKVLDQDPARLPGMAIGSRIPWSGVHETGTSINGKMLIPLYGRVGRKHFKAYVDELIRGGNAYFIRRNGKVILMAENIKEHDKPLAGFKRRYRKSEGITRLKRGTDIPIAVLVSRVTLRKRLDVVGLVMRRLPLLIERMGDEIEKSR